MKPKDGGTAFPYPAALERGMSLRDYFAVHAPEPKNGEVQALADMDRAANPHGDSYKPKVRTWEEIGCYLRYRYADSMLKAREE